VRVILLLLTAFAAAASAQQMTFTAAGEWHGRVLYAASACNPGENTVTVYGNRVWAAAQVQGLRPLTRSQLQHIAGEAKRMSIASRALLAVKLAALAVSAAQATHGIGERWATSLKAIAPVAAILSEAAPRIINEAAPEPAAIPDDLLPALIEIRPNSCWVGSLIGGGYDP